MRWQSFKLLSWLEILRSAFHPNKLLISEGRNVTLLSYLYVPFEVASEVSNNSPGMDLIEDCPNVTHTALAKEETRSAQIRRDLPLTSDT